MNGIRIACNQWGNWSGYDGARHVKDFFNTPEQTQAQAATAWLAAYRVSVAKLERPEHAGDWHDPLIRWGVYGPGSELQKFSTKKSATLYAKLRRSSASFDEASRKFCEA